MKKVLMSLMAMIIAINIVSAQNDAERATTPTTTQFDDDYVKSLRGDLQVTDDQMRRIRVLHTETYNSYSNIDERYLSDDKAYRARVHEILNERDEKLRDILNADQYSRYNTNRARYSMYDQRYFSDDLKTRNLEAPGRVREPVNNTIAKPKPADAPVEPSNEVSPAQPVNPIEPTN